ncbi:DCD domain-containing protein NRP-B-like [Populus nigra]|uniref:DCD domain-containing protein NRP-B-like n=1 Tax=Populus nigra TaxID=3691 RepID=UPI002B265F78|nr:DCD domain-containing protein NRP-B-like [Populus nigra]
MENNQQSFYQFSDQLRVQTSNLANLSLSDSIWSNSYGSKRPDERRNFDIRVGGEVNNLKQKGSDLNSFSDGWNPINDIKQKGSGLNLFNDGWNSVNDLKPKGSNLNLFDEGWSSVNDLKPKGSNLNVFGDGYNLKPKGSDLNVFNDGWKMGSSANNYGVSPIGPIGQFVGGSQKNIGINGGFNKGIYSKNNNIHNSNVNVSVKGNKNKGDDDFGSKSSKKNSSKKSNSNDNNDSKSAADKRFKTLPPSESLPRYETIGGYIFVCNNDTMAENLKRELFGLPPRYRDSVRQITPGLPLFLYNYSTHQLHGVFEAASFGGTNIDPAAWEDKKCPGESRFPAQVRVMTRKICEPLEEDSFRPILHHYDGPKFRLELNIPEALSLLDIFEEQNP